MFNIFIITLTATEIGFFIEREKPEGLQKN
jgi:hypothetical protein